ncbi:MAG: ribonuclease III [Verrucomicrobiota bacterium]|nr:ribonuclease III [Verrucomicrobiota bacterium]
MKKIIELEDRIKYTFKKKDYLVRALTHKSYLFESDDLDKDNQRLEFLGDAVLEFLVSVFLFKKYPDAREGELTKMRSSMIANSALVKIAESIDLGDYLFLGRGEDNQQGRGRASSLGDALEALIAAVYLDSDFETAGNVFLYIGKSLFENIEKLQLSQNPKGTLQELLQGKYGILPEYKVISVQGPEHAPSYKVALFVDGKECAEAIAGTKKEAEMKAAFIGLENYKNDI